MFAANSSFRVLNVNDTRISGRSGTGNSTSILSIGELHSDTNTRFNSFEGGSPAVHAVLQIGSLNTASDFNGPIQDGTGSGGTTSVGGMPGSGGAVATGGGTMAGADSLGTDASSDESGCGCRVAGERSNSTLLALLGMIGLVGVRARRRRPSIT